VPKIELAFFLKIVTAHLEKGKKEEVEGWRKRDLGG
jgi:hypothetical protein